MHSGFGARQGNIFKVKGQGNILWLVDVTNNGYLAEVVPQQCDSCAGVFL